MVERLQFDVVGTFKDELTSRVQNALDTMVEFGAGIDDLSTAMVRINEVAKEFAISPAQVAKALEKLVDESEDATFALNNLENVFKKARLEGKKVEDAAREMGQKFKETSVPINATTQALKVAEGATVALSAAMGKLYYDALVRAIEKNKDAKAAADELTGSLSHLQDVLGESILKTTDYTGVMHDLAGVLSDDVAPATKTAKDEAVDFSAAVKLIAGAVFSVAGPLPALAALASQFINVGSAARVALSAMDDFNKGKERIRISGEKQGADAGKDTALKQRKVRQDQLLGFIGGPEDRAEQSNIAQMEALAAQTGSAGENDPSFIVAQTLGKAPRSGGGGGGGRKAGAPGGTSGGVMLGLAAMQLASAIEDQLLLVQLGDATQARRDARLREGATIPLPNAFDAIGGLSRAVGDAGLESQNAQTIEMAESFGTWNAATISLNSSLQDLASGGVASASQAIGGLFEQIASGEGSFKALGANLMGGLGDLLVNFGQGLMVMATGVAAIEAGLISPAAAIGIALGAIALGGAFKGFAKRAQSQNQGSAASSGAGAGLERFARELTDKTADREGRTVVLNIDGREARGVLESIVGDGLSRGRIPVGNYLQSAGRAT